MNPSEAWTLLTVRTMQLSRVSAGHGSTTSSDIAALLAGLSNEPYLMGMAAELGDHRSLQQIELILWERARHIADREHWDPPCGEFTVRRMVGVALYEAINDPRCYVCNGTGEMAFALEDFPGMVLAPTFRRLVSGDTGGVRCPACVGGRVRISGRKKADLAGINKDTWTRLWARRYEPIFQIANGWRETASAHLRARLRAEEDGQVDTEVKRSAAGPDEIGAEKSKQINSSCVVTKLHDRKPARIAAPEESAPVSELNFAAFGRTVLRLNR